VIAHELGHAFRYATGTDQVDEEEDEAATWKLVEEWGFTVPAQSKAD
jgi:hypothetical protein